jgi:hypothetical protein
MQINRLRGPVGQGLDNDPTDVMTVKHLLENTGHLDQPDEGFSPFFDKPTEDGVFNIQDENGLKHDGVLFADGPTERTLLHKTGTLPEATNFNPTDLDLTGPVGNGLENNSRDVQAVAKGLKSLGLMKFDQTPVSITKDIDDGLQKFQISEGLNSDGTALPGGPTATALKSRVAQKQSPKDHPGQPLRNRIAEREDLKILRDRTQDSAEENKETRKINASQKRSPGALKSMNAHLEDFRKEGLPDAIANLEHFLSGDGTTKNFTREEARTYRPIRKGEIENRKRFGEQSFLGKTRNAKLNKKIKSIKDGETIQFPENWVIDHGPKEFRKDLEGRDRNFALGFGRTKLKSKGKFSATRNGNRVEITGVVNHNWSDSYDFHRPQAGSFDAKILTDAKIGKEFDMGSKWQQRVSATVRVKENGELELEGTKWEDVDDTRKEKSR